MDAADVKTAVNEKDAIERPGSRWNWLPTLGRREDSSNDDDTPKDGENMDDLPMLPERSASVLSRITWWWITPLLIRGYHRTLEKSDLWALPPDMHTAKLSDQLDAALEGRKQKVERWNRRAAAVTEGSMRRRWWRMRSKIGLGSADGQREFGIAKAIYIDHAWIAWRWWSALLLKVLGDTMQVLSVLLTRYMINFGAERYNAAPGQEPPLSHGVGAAIGLFLMLTVSTTLEQHFFHITFTCGIAVRSALCDTIFRRAVRLTNKSRGMIPNSRLITHISADASRLELVTGFGPMAFTATFQVVVIIVLLLVQLGVAALAGIAIMLVTVPAQFVIMRLIHNARSKSIRFTDARIKLTQEAIAGAKAIKLMAWEEPTIKAADTARRNELVHLRRIYLTKAFNAATAAAVPFLATVFAYSAYAHINADDGRSPAAIFSSLLLFNLMRLPLGMLPLALGEIADCKIALKRLAAVYQAETLDDVTLNVDEKAEYAVETRKASFVWEAPPPDAVKALSAKKIKKLKRDKKAGKIAAEAPTPVAQHPSGLTDINLSIPRGQLCAIVGQVGSGKSSLVQALIGEMKRTAGDVKFGGRIAYSPQIAWLQSDTIRGNILFGSEYDEARYRQVIHDACLEADLAQFPFGDFTQIGEKGVTLSGGQRQRVGIARCLYASDRSIVLLDDPLSALDAHVGQQLFDRAICGSLKDKTRLLVTNALHVLPNCDYVLVLNEGRIVERGTYAELISRNGQLAHLVAEFATKKDEEETEEIEPKDAIKRAPRKAAEAVEKREGQHTHMQDEERYRGAVTWRTWSGYFKAARAQILFPLLVGVFAIQQGAQILNSQTLVWWQHGQSGQFNKPTSFYLALYAGLGVGSAAVLFIVTSMNAYIGYRGSAGLHASAIRRVVYAPLSFIESTPAGRIMSRFAKDLDTIDSTLADNTRMCWLTFMAVISAITLIAIQEPWFLLAVAGMILIDFWVAWFYRHAARELKRLDNILRSAFVAHFAESLTGLASIRAYGETPQFIATTEKLIDRQNSAVFCVWASQRWLGLRLDLTGALLVLIVALIVVTQRFNPAQIGLALSYIVSVQPSLAWGVHVLCETEVNFNSVERVLHYANELEQEKPAEIAATKPPASWPASGSITFENVEMRYRDDLPAVLRSLNLEVKAGESLGICGRTGAGKSSILTTLLRLVELSAGRIVIDGVDVGKIGLRDLRQAIAVLPQDATLFAGSLRYNLDPYGDHDDASLNDALRRSHLNSKISSSGQSRSSLDSADESTGRFHLDSKIEADGANLSVGEKSLVSLARALVKNSQIVCLDEATASVDLATDEKIQSTIATEFHGRTIISIAHRLKTLLAYDRVLVLDQGSVAELDTPASLFAQNGIFRELCEQSAISAKDIEVAQAERDARRQQLKSAA